MNITMSWIWVINMTQSLHWSPISSQHRAWNVPLLLNIITISLRQTPEQERIKPHNHTREISRTRRGGHGGSRTARSATFRRRRHLIDWLPRGTKIFCCKQTAYYVTLRCLPCLCIAPAARETIKQKISPWSAPRRLHTLSGVSAHKKI